MADFDPATQNDLYKTFQPGWTANRDFAEMHEHVLREGTYLEEFGGRAAESPAQYHLRKAMSAAVDLCRDLIDVRVDNLFRTEPVRTFADSPYAAQIEAFCRDVDGGGTSLTDFMRQACWAHYVNGVDIVVDKDRGNLPPRSRADEAALRVFLHRFSPLERYDWACDHAGRYQWARYALGATARADERGRHADAGQFLTVTRRGWRLYTVFRDGRTPRRVASGPHALGVCPVVRLYWNESAREDYRAVPISLMTRLSPIARYMLNLVSQAQLDLYLTVAFFVACGVKPDQVPQEMGAAMAWAFENPDARIQNVLASVEHVAEKRQWLELCTRAMLRIGKIMGLLGDLRGRAASGVQVAIESGPLYSEMAATARQMARVEERLVQLVLSRRHPPAAGGLIPADRIRYSVHYNDRYTLESAVDLVAQAQQFSRIGVSREVPSLLRLLLRKVADATGRQGDPDYDAALGEIARAAFRGRPAGGGDAGDAA
jgi:hypothetical protein